MTRPPTHARFLLAFTAFTLAALAGCGGAKGQAHLGTNELSASASGTDNQENAWSGTTNAPATATATSTPAVLSTPASTAAPTSPNASVPPAPRCPLVCNIANRGRVATADEGRFTNALAGATDALHSCARGPRIPSLTLRFDSTGTLTHFGVDVDGTADGTPEEACLESAEKLRPDMTFAGPSTVRCAERCEAERRSRR